MATTSPDNIRTPNPNDNFNLIADWATTASDVQSALVKRANMYVGTSAQRAAFTTAPEGVHWQDTDGAKIHYVRRSGAWARPSPIIATGTATVTMSTSAGATVNVSFPPGTFTSPPNVQATKNSSTGAKYVVYTRNITASGFVLGLYSGDGSSGSATVDINWFAISS